METKIGKVLIGGQEAAPPSSEAPATPTTAVPAAPVTKIGKVYINGHEAVHKGCGGMAIAFPDVCLCPPGPPAGPVPVPLTNIVQAKDMVGGALTVVIQGYPAGHRDSYFATSTGNEVSRNTGGGITSHAVQGTAHFGSSSRDVLIEGKYAVRDGDLVTQNQNKNRMPANCPPSVWMGTVCPGTRPAVRPKKYTKVLQEGDDEIHVMLVDVEGNALTYEPYSLTTPSGMVVEARTLLDGGIHVKKVKSGRCKLVLPNRDSNELRERRTNPKRGSQRIRYRPCLPLDVVTGKTYEVEVPVRRSFWLHLNVDATAAASQDDKFVMKSTDGAYECVLTVKDNCDPGKAGLTLDFPNLIAGLTYTLVHDTGAEGEMRIILNHIPYDTLFRTKPVEED
jgi:hypothetical protein